MSLTETKHEDTTTQKRDEYVRQLQEYNDEIEKLQRERLFLEKDLKFLDRKIANYTGLVTDLRILIKGYNQLMGFADDVEPDNINHSKVEFVKNIASESVAPPTAVTEISDTDLSINKSHNTDGLNKESDIHDEKDNPSTVISTQQNDFHAGVANVVRNESNSITESGEPEVLSHVATSKKEEHPLLNLLSSSNNTKIVGRKTKYRLKQQFTGLGIAEAAEAYMSQNPNQVYHVSALVSALYDGVNDSNASSIYKTLSTQLLLVSKKKGRIKKSHKGTYYYS